MSQEPQDSSYELAPQAPAPAPTRRVEPAPVVDRVTERKCPLCGFVIVGKTTRNRCPECAAPLDTAAASLLQFSAPGWVRSLSYGSLLLALAVLGQIAAVIATWARQQPLGGYLHAGAPAAALLGAWLATRCEPDTRTEALPARWLVRLFSLAVAAAWMVLAFVHLPTEARRPIMYLALLLTSGQAISLGVYLNALAIRVPSDALAWQAFNLSWIIGIECVFIVALHFVRVADVEHLQYFFCAFPMIAGMVAVLVWAAAILVMFGVQFQAVATAGEDIAYRRTHRPVKGPPGQGARAARPGGQAEVNGAAGQAPPSSS